MDVWKYLCINILRDNLMEVLTFGADLQLVSDIYQQEDCLAIGSLFSLLIANHIHGIR